MNFILVGIPEGKRPPGKPRCSWKDIKNGLGGTARDMNSTGPG
jgi:hypothetical protein